MIDGMRTSKLAYDLSSKSVKIYLGINNMQIDQRDKDPRMLYQAINVMHVFQIYWAPYIYVHSLGSILGVRGG
jgi:hypothetical protein